MKRKLFVYSYREFDEAEFFQKFAKEYDMELGWCKDAPTMENAHLAEGFECLSILTTVVDAALMERFHELGIRMISTRTVGYDHVDVKRAEELGIQVSNASYTPNCVADYTIMLMLMAIRKMKRIMQRAEINDFSLKGIQGRIMPSFTVGIIGTGRIGSIVTQYLSGFGCKVYAYDLHENPAVKDYAEYADLETIYRECNMISLHMPLNEDNFHMINRETIAKMRDNVVIVNTGRGSLIDSQALIDGIVSGKVGAAALDVVENEFNMYYYDLKSDILDNRELYILRGFPNVIVTPHMAFYTDQSVSDMVLSSVKGYWHFSRGEKNPWRVI